MDYRKFTSQISFFLVSLGSLNLAVAMGFPDCSSSSFDEDGDGYGWENEMTCVVVTGQPVVPTDPGPSTNLVYCSSSSFDEDGDGYGWENSSSCLVKPGVDDDPDTQPDPTSPFPFCSSSSFDEDNDGYGWENKSTCLVRPGADDQSNPDPIVNTDSGFPFCSSSAFDEDGDGFGWENKATCIVQPEVGGGPDNQPDPDIRSNPAVTFCSSPAVDLDGDGYGWENSKSCFVIYPDVPSSFTVSDITDVVLTAGQSNALAPGTTPDDTLDAPHERIFAWTKHQGWKVASLKTQVWVQYDDPRNKGRGQLIPGFRIAKSLVEKDPNKVVGLIVTGQTGMSIDFWHENGGHYPEILSTVDSALDQLPNNYQVDLIWWMQGEADDPHAYDYGAKLHSLISRFRSQSWFNGGYFIANETVGFDVNPIIRSLNRDNDPLTCYSEGEGLEASDGTHFDEPAIRLIGDYVADKFIHGCYNAR